MAPIVLYKNHNRKVTSFLYYPVNLTSWLVYVHICNPIIYYVLSSHFFLVMQELLYLQWMLPNTDTFHQYNISLHSYLIPLTSTSSALRQDHTNKDSRGVTPGGLSKEGVDDKTLDLSISDQGSSVSPSQRIIGLPVVKKVVAGSRKNKSKSVDIQTYFTSPVMCIDWFDKTVYL